MMFIITLSLYILLSAIAIAVTDELLKVEIKGPRLGRMVSMVLRSCFGSGIAIIFYYFFL